MSVTDVEAALANVNPDIKQWRCTSDHEMHVQIIHFKTDEGAHIGVALATWNLLNEQYVKYIACKSPDGQTEYGSHDDQMGLHDNRLADYKFEAERTAITLTRIEKFFESTDVPTVLCLQECSRKIVAALQKSPVLGWCGVRIEVGDGATNCVCTLSTQLEVHRETQIGEERCLITQFTRAWDTGKLTFIVANVHLYFNTARNLELFKKFFVRDAIFVVGDYNIPVKPISAAAIEEGCTATLREFIHSLLSPAIEGRYDHYLLGIHPDSFTNWNVRKNCKDRSDNSDHFDNILFLWREGATCGVKSMTGVYAPLINA